MKDSLQETLHLAGKYKLKSNCQCVVIVWDKDKKLNKKKLTEGELIALERLETRKEFLLKWWIPGDGTLLNLSDKTIVFK